MEISTQSLIEYILWPLGLIVAWGVRVFFGRLSTLEQQYAALRLLIAEEYVKRDDITEMMRILHEIQSSVKKE